ncbi:hypothetical protein SMC26_39145 [Actinomadura fulvescens]|uniref:Uncharacterized protein n=1 Tax=Actinomadura fulvescens TaxID=46160 RepID=A0ABP6D7Q3_9ACTN
MTRTEDRLRAALDDAAQTVAPDSLVPLTVPPRRRFTWMAPLAVAAALALVVFGVTTLIPKPSDEPDRTAFAGAPTHLLAIRKGQAVVLDGTGRKVADVPAAQGRYEGVAATADRRTFFLAAAAGKDEYLLYRVEIAADGSPSRPRPLPGGAVRLAVHSFGSENGFAAAPDGSKVALVGLQSHPRTTAVVIDARTGARRTWSAPGSGWIKSVSWSPDNRTLGFLWWDGQALTKKATLRLLDTSRDGTDLLASRPLRTIEVSGPGIPAHGEMNVFTFNPDGETLTAQVQGAEYGPDDVPESALAGLSARTGEPTGWTARLPVDSFFVKTDASGNHFLQVDDGRLGRVDNGRFSWITKTHEEYEDASW